MILPCILPGAVARRLGVISGEGTLRMYLGGIVLIDQRPSRAAGGDRRGGDQNGACQTGIAEEYAIAPLGQPRDDDDGEQATQDEEPLAIFFVLLVAK